MKKQTMLDKAIGNDEVLAYINGQYSHNCRSNLYREIQELGLNPDEEDKTWRVAIGAALQHKTQGYKMAIVRINQQQEEK